MQQVAIASADKLRGVRDPAADLPALLSITPVDCGQRFELRVYQPPGDPARGASPRPHVVNPQECPKAASPERRQPRRFRGRLEPLAGELPQKPLRGLGAVRRVWL